MIIVGCFSFLLFSLFYITYTKILVLRLVEPHSYFIASGDKMSHCTLFCLARVQNLFTFKLSIFISISLFSIANTILWCLLKEKQERVLANPGSWPQSFVDACVLQLHMFDMETKGSHYCWCFLFISVPFLDFLKFIFLILSDLQGSSWAVSRFLQTYHESVCRGTEKGHLTEGRIFTAGISHPLFQ